MSIYCSLIKKLGELGVDFLKKLFCLTNSLKKQVANQGTWGEKIKEVLDGLVLLNLLTDKGQLNTSY
jgi:hypothetical protein